MCRPWATPLGRDLGGRGGVAVREGSAVYSRDGTVHRLTYDPDSGALRHFVVREGVLFTEDVALPASLIERVDDDVVRLAVDAGELPGQGPP